MKTIRNGWKIGLVLMFGVTPLCLAVNGDGQAPCWRDQAGTTRQTWRFDTSASPRAPEVVSNPAGNPQATITPNYSTAVGWYNTACLDYGTCDPDPYGTAQGFWDIGTSNATTGTVLLTVPNTVSAGATRYLWVQATVWIESGIAAYPAYAVSNAVQVGSAVNLLAENPTNSDGSFTSGAWYNQQTLWSVSGTTTSNNIVIKAPSASTVLMVDTVTVDTMQRSPAVNDTASTPRNVATNLTATLLANDGGPTLSVAGVSTPSAAGGGVSVGGGTVTYTPPTDYTGPDVFYYTNSDCAGGTAVAQVAVDVTGAGGPVANVNTYSRSPGVTLKIKVADLLANDTGTGITFAGLNLTSTNGVTVTTNATTIFYSNANNVSDRLTYYIRDSLSARAGGYVLIQPGSTTSEAAIVRLQRNVPGLNTNTLTVAGIPNYSYILQFATNINRVTWFNLSTNAAGTNGLWTVLDPTATNDQRFYRTSTP